ncbi:hypothetical protein FB45DRAFT_996999 [Roridomyces roridus]|uniref:Uncharacterized protein n=1 Tax=Roridomyces roridus TaxID=1738132 RepID=A0AAD7CI59_9AGAR|nr:hypothetical protein FB45DRAFT_996999 [Roridomyces roridus]
MAASLFPKLTEVWTGRDNCGFIHLKILGLFRSNTFLDAVSGPGVRNMVLRTWADILDTRFTAKAAVSRSQNRRLIPTTSLTTRIRSNGFLRGCFAKEKTLAWHTPECGRFTSPCTSVEPSTPYVQNCASSVVRAHPERRVTAHCVEVPNTDRSYGSRIEKSASASTPAGNSTPHRRRLQYAAACADADFRRGRCARTAPKAFSDGSAIRLFCLAVEEGQSILDPKSGDDNRIITSGSCWVPGTAFSPLFGPVRLTR